VGVDRVGAVEAGPVADETVRLDIIDDGTGFDLDTWEETADAASSYGLRFMRARLRELGGGLDIESAPGEGTAISAYLPIHADQNRRLRPKAMEETP